jgi:hypothetical protein
MGILEIDTSDTDRESVCKQFQEMGIPAIVHSPETRRQELESVVQAARKQLIGKATKYAATGASFGLLIHSRIATRSSQTEPELWSGWLSDSERQRAEVFPAIYLVKSNSIIHEALILRQAGNWLDPASRHIFKDLSAHAKFRTETEEMDQRLAGKFESPAP